MKVMANFDNILTWMNLTLARLSALDDASIFPQSYLLNVASILYRLSTMDTRTTTMVMASREAVKIFLRAWTLRSKNTRKVHSTLGSDEGCMVTNLLRVYTSDEKWLSIFVDVAMASPKHVKAFCDALICRVDQLSTFIDKVCKAELVGDEWMKLLFILHRLQQIREIHRQLRISNYLSRLMTTLVSLQQHFPPKTILRFFFTIFSLSADPQAVEELVDGGLVTVAANTLMKVDLAVVGQDERQHAQNLIQALAAYTFHPRTLAALRHTVGELPRYVEEGLNHREYIGSRWDELVYCIGPQSNHLNGLEEEGLSICDNDSHDEMWIGPYMVGGGVKACSGCHLVAYCSPECQKTDWKERHKPECPIVRHSYHERSATNTKYRHATRAFHLRVIEGVCNPQYRLLTESQPGQRGWEFLMMINACWDQPTENAITLCPAPIPRWIVEQKKVGDCPAMDGRAKRLVDEYVKSKAPKTRLVEFVTR
ncbi:hypothetical protein CC2G_003448 [Coprinopsis cinerea AmutBmut pab1-1]|nr:hypothetical protein CC2G_003448 [Coprinopsis cinerea AmutBmut pab1-1]